MRILPVLLIILNFCSYAQELRGTWIARNSLTSKDILAAAMDSIAANNFNTVYINAWSRGYPLWQSDVFFSHTGIKIDPTYSNRDILAEAIAEGHKRGLHVEAWFEYGFVGGWTGNQLPGKKGPIFDPHPDWVAKKNDGTEIDNSNFYWMIHTHPEVQDFLIALSTEVARNYDIDGIELDRIRYSSLQYGYDYYTDSLYRSEHNGNPPPENFSDTSWLRWRADKLNEFMARAYDSIKAVSPNVNVSNAPSLYSSSGYSSYNSFAQDWIWWVNNNKVDNVQVQSYVGSSSSFSSILTYLRTLVNNQDKVFPSFAVKPGGNVLTTQEAINFVNVVRSKEFKGTSIWYFTDLAPYFAPLKAEVFSEKTYPPYTSADWRDLYKITNVISSDAVRTGSWLGSTLPGFQGQSIYASGTGDASITYFIDVPETGYYELYAFIVSASTRTDSAAYYVYSSDSVHQNFVNQKLSSNRRWYKLGDYLLEKGRRAVVKLTNENVADGEFVSGDAVYISLNRKLSPDVITSVEVKEEKKKETNLNPTAFPNPFNSQVKLRFYLNSLEPYNITMYSVTGERVLGFSRNPVNTGVNEILLDLSSSVYSSGIYFVNLSQSGKGEYLKLIMVK
jgi:uncharacterized lipoprotein YddW (UPF0748 family)